MAFLWHFNREMMDLFSFKMTHTNFHKRRKKCLSLYKIKVLLILLIIVYLISTFLHKYVYKDLAHAGKNI